VPGYHQRIAATAIAPPTSWATTNGGTDEGAIPANVSVNAQPMVTAGFANDVEAVTSTPRRCSAHRRRGR
jgi:hypothetical protein